MITFHPRRLPYVSPSSAATLQACPLRVAFQSDPVIREMPITGTAARLGSICHRILERIAQGAIPPDADWETAFATLWDSQIAAEEQKIQENARTRHLGRASYWSQYGMRRARLKSMTRQILERLRNRRTATRPEGTVLGVERRYVAFNGEMVGSADVVRIDGGELVIEDYKTGAITHVDEVTGDEQPRDDYIQQLLLYAAMHYDTTKQWPSRGRLIPLSGVPLDIIIDPEQALQTVERALNALHVYNAAVDGGATQTELARPSLSTCRWCPFQGVCDPLWDHINSSWEWTRHAVICRIMSAEQRSTGSIVAEILVERGTVAHDMYLLQAPDGSQGVDLIELKGKTVRVTDLEKHNGRLVMTPTSQIWSVLPVDKEN